MKEALEILKYTVPAFIVFLATFFILKRFMDNEYRKSVFDLKKDRQKLVTPIRLQAYERIVLFLERISMETLIRRSIKPGMTFKQLELELIKNIRNEMEHNLSQQLYISSTAWKEVKIATEEAIKVVHISASSLTKGHTAIDLSKNIFAVWGKLEKNPIQIALENLKKEVRQLY